MQNHDHNNEHSFYATEQTPPGLPIGDESEARRPDRTRR